MENQNLNIDDYNRNSTPRPMRMSIIFGPLILNYVVSFLVQLVFCGVILFGVMANYMYESAEFAALIEEMEVSDTYNISDSVDTFMTDEVMDQITTQTLEVAENNIAILTICSALVSIPVFTLLMYRDRKKRLAVIQKNVMSKINNQGNDIARDDVQSRTVIVSVGERVMVPHAKRIYGYGLLAVGSVALCVLLNNLLTLSQLAEVSQAYQESSDSLYSIGFVAQIIGLGMITPIAEEILFRGIIHKRLRSYLKPGMAIFWSALIFGVYHGNVVQLIYAFFCGIMLAWAYEKFGTIKAPIMGHICMNITSLVLSQYNLFYWMFEDPIRLTVITVCASTLAATSYVVFTNMIRSGQEDNKI